jgi:hypothetical protein
MYDSFQGFNNDFKGFSNELRDISCIHGDSTK